MSTLTAANQMARPMALIGLFFGVVYSVGGLVWDLLTVGLNAGTAMAFGALIGMPLLFGAVGWVCGLLGGLFVQAINKRRER